jgi:uncharacterized protein YjlB
MSLHETVKKAVEKATGFRRTSQLQVARLTVPRKPLTFSFPDDGFTPNNPYWPVLLYRKSVRFPRSMDPAAVLEEVFAANSWGDMWRNGIYDYLHYHSQTHEVLGVARGKAKIRLGGAKGKNVELGAGDVVVIPAGTGHQCLKASPSFLVVGAYPPSGVYDECGPAAAEHDRAVKRISRVARPRKDPVWGAGGPLMTIWKRKR